MIARRAAAVLVPLMLVACSAEDRLAVPADPPEPVTLSVHPVLGLSEGTGSDGSVPEEGGIARDEEGQLLRLGPAALTGKDVMSAVAGGPGPNGVVTVEWRESAVAQWTELTGNAACGRPGEPTRRVAFVLDGRMVSSPQVTADVQCEVGIVAGSAGLTGSFTRQEAEELAERLNAASTAR